jgi:hypothetical protein
MSIYDETVEQRKARLKAEGEAEDRKRAEQIEASIAQTAGMNEAYFRKQEELAQQIAEQNVKNAAAQKERDKSAAARRIAENKANMECKVTTNKPPEGFIDMAGTIPCKRNPSITLQPLPSKYPSSDPRHGMSDELILRMGMKL